MCVTEYNCTLGSTARGVDKRRHNWIQSSLSSEQRSLAEHRCCRWKSSTVLAVQ